MSGKGVYLWVNKDAASLNSTDYRSAVNSFIQKDKKKVFKEERLKKLQDSIQIKQLTWRQREAGPLSVRAHDSGSVVPILYHGNEEIEIWIAVSSSTCGLDPAIVAYKAPCTFKGMDHLDPFVRLTGTVSLRERNMLHYYLSMTQAAVCGTSNGTPCQPANWSAVVSVQKNQLWLQWVLLSAEIYILGDKAAESSMTVLSRKALLYKTMHELIADPRTRYLDTTITALAFAAIAESMVSNLSTAQSHLVGVRHLIEGCGGIKQLSTAISFPVLNTFIWLGTGTAAFPNSISLERAIAAFLHLMDQLQECQQKPLHSNVWSKSAMISTERQQLEVPQSNAALLKRSFGPASALRPFLQVPFYDFALRPQVRSHMALLWILNIILWELRCDYAGSSWLVDTLHRQVETKGGAESSLSDGTFVYSGGHLHSPEAAMVVSKIKEPTLKATAVLQILADCSDKLKRPHFHAPTGTGPQGTSRFSNWWQAVDVVELLQLLSEPNREIVLAQLSRWVIGNSETVLAPDSINSSPVELQPIADEMRQAWTRARR